MSQLYESKVEGIGKKEGGRNGKVSRGVRLLVFG
jgi:hypothetical protein